MGTVVTSAGSGNRRSGDLRYAWWISLFVLCAVLGGLIGLSLKTQNRISAVDLPARNYEGLAQQYLIVKRRTDDDQRTIASLQAKIQQIEQTAPESNAQSKLIQDELARTQFIAGLTSVAGPGVIVTLDDSKKRFADAPLAIQMTGIIHDTDVLQTTNELKAAGAEAVSVNDQRLVATSPIRCAGPTIYINGIPQTPPYVIRAVGDAATLAKALRLPQGVYDTLSGIDPDMIKIEQAKKLLLPAYDGPVTPKYAHPVLAVATDNQSASVKE